MGGSTWTIHMMGLVCALVATLLYLNTYDADLLFDDIVAIQQNSDLRPQSPWTSLLWHDFWGYDITDNSSHKSYRPLCSATFKINFHLHELEPMGYHLGNVLFNAVVCYLFVVLCGRVFENQLWPTLISGLLYTVHPIHTEAVAGTVGRAELLSAMFFLLAMWTYHRVEGLNGKRWFVATLFLCLCSFLSKEQGIVAAGVCLAYEVFVVHKMDLSSIVSVFTLRGKLPWRHKKLLHRAIILALFSITLLIARIILMQGGPKFSKSDHPGQTLSTPFRQLYYLYLVFVNSWLLIFPSLLRHDYRFGYIPLVESFIDHRHIFSTVFITSAIVLGLSVTVRQRTKSHIACFALALSAIFFLPISNLFVRVGFVVAERVLYIPSMGWCLLVALGASFLLKSEYPVLRHLTKFGLGILILSQSVKTVHRNRGWNNGFQLYVEALKLYPEDGLMVSNLGYVFKQRNDSDLSEQAQLFAIKLSPRTVQPYRNYGAVLQDQGRYMEAEKMYRKAIKMSGPRLRKYQKTPEIYKSLAEVISTNESRYSDSLRVIDLLISIAPDLPLAHQERARYLMKLNRTEDAEQALQKVQQLQPNMADAFLQNGKLYLELNETDKAAHAFREGLRVEPQNGYIMFELGCLMVRNQSATSEDLQLAHKYLISVVSADPSLEEAHFHLAKIYFKTNKLPRAKVSLERTLELDPNHKDALLLLGYAYYMLEDFNKAIDTLSVVPREDLFQNTYYNVIDLLNNLYVKSNQDDKAEELFHNVLQKDSDNLSALNGLGALRIRQKQFREAAEYFKQVIKVDEHNKRALTFLKELRVHP